MLYCKATTGLLMTELHKLLNESLLSKSGDRFVSFMDCQVDSETVASFYSHLNVI